MKALEWADVHRIASIELKLRALAVRDQYATLLKRELPNTLAKGVLRVFPTEPGYVKVRTYSDYDALILDQAAWSSFDVFDGRRSTQEILAAGEGLGTLPAAELMTAVDWGILKAAESQANAPPQP